MVLQYLRRATRFPGGISSGGGETGFEPQPQPLLLTKRLTADVATQQVPLPAGTHIFGHYVAPVFGSESSAGTIDIINKSDSDVRLIEAGYGAGASAVSAAKSGGNTGDGTFVVDVTTPVLAGGKSGVYTIRFLTTTSVRIEDPDGFVIGDMAIGGSTSDDVTINEKIKGVLTQGATPFVADDGFDVTVTYSAENPAVSATAVQRVARAAPLTLAADSLIEFSAASLDAGKAVDVGLEVILPRIRI